MSWLSQLSQFHRTHPRIADTYHSTYYTTIPDYTSASLDYSPTSDIEFDPSEDPSSDHIPSLPSISPFLSSTNDTTDGDTPDTPPSPTPFTEITSSTQRSPVIPHSSSHASSYFHSDASSDSSLRHSLSDHSYPDLPSTSAGPSRKRSRSPMTYVPALPPVSEALSPIRANLIPYPKRVRDSGYLADVEVDPRETSLRDDVILRGSDEPHLEQDIDPEIQTEINECVAYADSLRDRGIDARVVVEAVDREESETGARGPVEVRFKRVMHPVMPEDTPEPAQEERAVEYTYEILGSLVLRSMITQRLSQSIMYRSLREFRGRNGGNENGGNGGNGNEGNGGNGNGNRNRNHGMNYGGFMPVARECTFQDFLKCKPYNFSGTEGVVELTHWLEKMETVFNISNFPSKYQLKYATCTL
ncbi:hypothetical protein Tco_0930979 [Tanacetum coccineum]